MPWHPDSPVGNISVRANGAPMRENTTYILNSQRVNHYFDEDNVGKHKFISMPYSPALNSEAGQLDLYNKNGGGGSELWMIRDNILATNVQLTNSLIPAPIADPVAPANSTRGVTWLAGGFLLQWGFRDTSGASSSNKDVSFIYPFSHPPFSVTATAIRASSSPGSDFGTVVNSVTETGFIIGNIGGHTMQGWYWMAIGHKV